MKQQITSKMQKKSINLEQYLLIILGFLLIVLLFWHRLLRERLPKEIPFNLSWVLFLILIVAIIIQLYILYNVIRRYFFKQNVSLNREELYLPLILLDSFIKEKVLSKKVTNKLIILLIKYSNKYLKYSQSIYVLWHVAQILLPIILCIDIFYLKEINLFYKILWLLLLLLIYRYLLYSLKTHYNEQCKLSDQHIAIQWNNPPSHLVPEDEDFVVINTNTYIEKTVLKKPNEIFLTSFSLYLDYMASLNKRLVSDPSKYRLNFADILSTETHVYHTLQHVYKIIYTYNTIDYKLKPLINFIKSTLYVICWSYVLFVSYASLYYASFDDLWAIQNMQEPFSQLNIFPYYENEIINR